MIKRIKLTFPDCIVGYSDHSVPIVSNNVLKTAVCFGAKIIEKHFTYDKTIPGNDHYHSFDGVDLINFRKDLLDLRSITGGGLQISPCESSARSNARRKICLKRNVKKGEILSADNTIPLRSSIGIDWKYIDLIDGAKFNCDMVAGSEVTLGSIS